MKKFLALVLTLAMVLTLNVGMIASTAAEAPLVDVTGKNTVTVGEVEYTVIADLAAVSTKGNYILSGDVEVPADAVITFAAGTVLNGNGYTITVEGNDRTAPLAAAPFALAAGDEIVIANVNFGNDEAPIYLRSEEALVEGEDPADLAVFANDEAPQLDMDGNPMIDDYIPVTATFEAVNFTVFATDKLNVNVAAVIAVANGNYSFTDCSVTCDFNAGDMTATDGVDLTQGYVGGFIASSSATSNLAFESCQTTVGSVIVNDWRTGGFVGNVKGGISVVNCVNNATITNRTLVTAGFLAWVEGETLSAWTFEGNVNNGDITAYMGPKGTDGKAHGDDGRDAAGLIAYVYSDTDNTCPPIVVSDCVNNGNVYGEDKLSGIIGRVRVGYYTYTAEDGTKTYAKNTTIIENCVNTGDVVCTVLDAVSGAHVLGGICSRVQGPTYFYDCVNYGRIDANGMDDGHLGGIIGNTSGANAACANAEDPLVLENCFNYGAIQNGRRIGGMIGASECEVSLTRCVNYGYVNSGTSTRADNHAAGIVGFADQKLHTITDCINLGNVYGSQEAGGIVASTRSTNVHDLVITNCLNAGDIGCADDMAGGIVGMTHDNTTITNCMNVGRVYATSSQTAGQIVGDAKAVLTVENCYAFGSVDTTFPANLNGVYSFMCAADVVVADGAFMVTYIGTAEDSEDERNVAATAEEALAIIAELYGEEAPFYVVDDAVAYIEPAVRGVQTATAGVVDGNIAVRFTGVVNAMDYEKVEFTYTVNGGTATTVAGVQMLDVKAVSLSGNTEIRDAAIVGGAALYCTELNVAATGTVEIVINIIATADGVAYEGFAATITVVDGVIVG